ncbi:MAG: permease-like cell division protein FtsX [Actinomycetota bacterium]|nr:permease-like cell division protein FtsX [Actinomycetota bacterium]
MRFQFILSEINIGLRRNVTMTISVVLVTTVSLLLLGVGVLAQEQVSAMKTYWYDRVQVSIFLCSTDSTRASCSGGAVTDAQRQSILADLKSPQLATYVAEVYYESKEEAFERFKKQYVDSTLRDNVTADQMPESYRVRLRDPQQYASVSKQFRDRPGVDTVQDQNQVLDRLFALLNGLKWCAWFVAGMTLVCSVLLVATTIRLNAFTRRRETGIMRLVGASNLVIQLPFVLESLISAVAGAFIASVILLLFTQFAIQGWLRSTLKFIDNWVGLTDALTVLPWMFLLGMLIAGVSSFLSLRRYLKV